MNKRNVLIGIGIGAVLGGILYYVWYKRKQQKNAETIALPTNTSTPINEKLDETTNGYKIVKEALTKWKNFFKVYAKDGFVLRDIATGNKLSQEATETAYIFATKQFLSIEEGIGKDKSLSSVQKGYLLEMIDDYYNNYLPVYFDKTRYNTNAIWYQTKLGQMQKVDYYKL